MGTAANFQWPEMYHFPPFFTLQVVEETRKRQMDQWCDLIKSFCQHTNTYELTVTESMNSPVFNNKQIDRKASNDLIQKIIEYMEVSGNAESIDEQRTRFRIYWRSIDEWANMIYNWIERTSQTDIVLTLYEIREGDSSEGEEFYGMDDATFRRALDALERVGKCSVFAGEETDGDGVKFYSV
eukprot:CFRG8157T1